MTEQLLGLADWLIELGVSRVVMEATSDCRGFHRAPAKVPGLTVFHCSKQEPRTEVRPSRTCFRVAPRRSGVWSMRS